MMPSFIQEPESTVISQHAAVTLHCKVSPSSASVRWLFDDQRLDPRDHQGINVQGTDLRFPNPHSIRAGVYRCIATTTAGSIISRPAVLQKPGGCFKRTYIYIYIPVDLYIYTCRFIYIYTCRLIYIYTPVDFYIYIYTCRFIYIHTCIFIYIYTPVDLYIYTPVDIYIYIYIYNCRFIYMYTPVDLYIYIHTC